jgi:hypothetical protein
VQHRSAQRPLAQVGHYAAGTSWAPDPYEPRWADDDMPMRSLRVADGMPQGSLSMEDARLLLQVRGSRQSTLAVVLRAVAVTCFAAGWWLAVAGAQDGTPAAFGIAAVPPLLIASLGLALVLLAMDAPPTLATRWAWLWMCASAGLALPLFLLLEPALIGRRHRVPGHSPRITGGWGLLIAIPLGLVQLLALSRFERLGPIGL